MHAVLERLFDLPAGERTSSTPPSWSSPQWERLARGRAELSTRCSPRARRGAAEWLESARGLLGGYFALEDPRGSSRPSGSCTSSGCPSGLLLRGYIDRLDRFPTGDLRVVDYKTGSAPREAFEARALFQLKFYALVLWRSEGRAPTLLRLIYLGDA